MYICIYVYMYIYIDIHIYVHMYIHIYIHYFTLDYITLHYITLHYIHTYIHSIRTLAMSYAQSLLFSERHNFAILAAEQDGLSWSSSLQLLHWMKQCYSGDGFSANGYYIYPTIIHIYISHRFT